MLFGIQANHTPLYSKTASEYFDPCQDFADRSLKCMKRNAYDREMCHDYFQYVRALVDYGIPSGIAN